MNDTSLKAFLEIPYDRLEKLNIKGKFQRLNHALEADFEKEYRAFLSKEHRIKAVTLCFSDIEGHFHMLDYDKKHLLSNANNLTFDGSSVRGFTALAESDLRVKPVWSTFRYLPADIFGSGKVVVFGSILNRDYSPYLSDVRNVLDNYLKEIKAKYGYEVYLASEIEGFLVEGVNAEQNFNTTKSFELISTGGYFHSLPQGSLRQFIDRSAEAQRAMGFENEKDHPEVAPSQFELNFKYAPAMEICDEVQLYKLTCRQVAEQLGMTATFLPKPITGINGSGMHTNLSIWKNGKNLFADQSGYEGLSTFAWDFISRILNHAPELCLILNSSVNGYRRLDPHFEAPNQIQVSVTNRGAIIRVPIADENSTRIEVRSIGPDANPYLTALSLIKTGLTGQKLKKNRKQRQRVRFLPSTITEALRIFKSSSFIEELLGTEIKDKYAKYKQYVADRSPKELGTIIKTSEVIHHHEITNQVLWGRF